VGPASHLTAIRVQAERCYQFALQLGSSGSWDETTPGPEETAELPASASPALGVRKKPRLRRESPCRGYYPFAKKSSGNSVVGPKFTLTLKGCMLPVRSKIQTFLTGSPSWCEFLPRGPEMGLASDAATRLALESATPGSRVARAPRSACRRPAGAASFQVLLDRSGNSCLHPAEQTDGCSGQESWLIFPALPAWACALPAFACLACAWACLVPAWARLALPGLPFARGPPPRRREEYGVQGPSSSFVCSEKKWTIGRPTPRAPLGLAWDETGGCPRDRDSRTVRAEVRRA